MKIEDLANEVFYEIFEYLDYFQSYEIFSNLNKRFQDLFINSTCPIKINLGSISKSTFESYFQNIILPHQHRIRSLHLSNSFIIDFFLLSVSLIRKLTHLQTFIIKGILSSYLENLFNDLSVLPNLSSLVIICKYHVPKRNHLYEQIFQLSALKYCKFSIQEYHHSEYLPIQTNQFSPITHLLIGDIFNVNEFFALLSCVPQLHRLSIHKLSTSMYTQVNICSRIPNQLTHVSLDLENVYFNDFEPLIKHVFYQVQVLHISTPPDRTYLIANRWESLIPLYMPHLRIFDLHHRVYTTKTEGEIYMDLIDQFESSFWFERQWFFAYHMKLFREYCEIYFYSTDPYRYESIYLLI
ncbi:unnamed protein product [Rotaria sp. Silwood2]|nr:unnamed protein product [Rotaria sp. Silwood2]